jgi:hypothetical protein
MVTTMVQLVKNISKADFFTVLSSLLPLELLLQ